MITGWTISNCSHLCFRDANFIICCWHTLFVVESPLPKTAFWVDILGLPVVVVFSGSLHCIVFSPLHHLIWPSNLSSPFFIVLRSWSVFRRAMRGKDTIPEHAQNLPRRYSLAKTISYRLLPIFAN